jgi:hypothetical protein
VSTARWYLRRAAHNGDGLHHNHDLRSDVELGLPLRSAQWQCGCLTAKCALERIQLCCNSRQSSAADPQGAAPVKLSLVNSGAAILMTNATVLTDRFDRALLYATLVHGGQVRKGTSTPYVAHLLAVAATVLEYGGDEDLAIAALLHDSVEDQGGMARLEDVRNRFGERVARIVEACSDSLADRVKGERKAE